MSDEAKLDAGNQSRQMPDLFLDLIHEVIDRPDIAEWLPDAGQVELSSVDLHGHVYLLAAFKPPDDEVWTAHIVRATPIADAPDFRGSLSEEGRVLRDREAIVRTLTASG